MPKTTPEEIKAFYLLSLGGTDKFGTTSYQKLPQEEAQITSSGSRNFHNPEQPMTAQTVVGIGSISKQFTAATLLKLWDNELSAKDGKKIWFENGVDTTLKNFIPALHKQYPQCSELFDKIAHDENYDKIKLRDLLNHTHGLGARNDKKAGDLVQQADGAPLELAAIANVTEKREGEKYGEWFYGNFGFDLAAMIIETVAIDKGVAKSFDEAVTNLVLQPQGLIGSHPQQDHAELYRDQSQDIAVGYAVDEKTLGEFKMNGTSNTRAAGGFKSNVEDLAKFSHAYMEAGMFVNEEVKQMVLDRSRGGLINPKAQKQRRYHLAIQENEDGTIGHSGADLIFFSDLRLNPQTGEVRARLEVAETLTDNIACEVFVKIYPQYAEKIKDRKFWEECEFMKFYEAAGSPQAQSEACDGAVASAVESNVETQKLLAKYVEIREQVAARSRKDLLEKRSEVVEKISTVIKSKNTLAKISDDENFHGIAAISAVKAVSNLEDVTRNTQFPIHSVGKVLSGTLMIELLAQGIITADDLNAPMKLPPSVVNKLPPAVLQRASQTTLLQAMTHQANLGDYLENYAKHLQAGGEPVANMDGMLKFVGENWQDKYSNDGLMLASIALARLYNLKTGQNLSYEAVLEKLVIAPSKSNISMVKSE